MVVLTIQSVPALQFSDGMSSGASGLAWPRLISIGEIRSRLRIGGGETPTLSVTINNGDGRLTDQLTRKHLAAPVSLERDGRVLFSGYLRRIQYGGQITLDMEA